MQADVLRVSDYANSLETGVGVFRTLSIDDYVRTMSGDPAMVCGNNAVVFSVVSHGQRCLLKCFFHAAGCRMEIYDYIKERSPELISSARLLPNEMYVWNRDGCGAYRNVVFAPWIEGVTLGRKMRDAAFNDDRVAMKALANALDVAMLSLLHESWAHGDLKPDNIIITPTGGIRLVDYDAMYIPELAGSTATELGTPGWQHPQRDASFFNKHIDDYSIALLSVTLHAAALDPQLLIQGASYDCSLLDPQHLFSGHCAVIAKIERLFATHGFDGGRALCKMLLGDTAKLPGLTDVLESVVKSASGG